MQVIGLEFFASSVFEFFESKDVLADVNHVGRTICLSV